MLVCVGRLLVFWQVFASTLYVHSFAPWYNYDVFYYTVILSSLSAATGVLFVLSLCNIEFTLLSHHMLVVFCHIEEINSLSSDLFHGGSVCLVTLQC